MDVAITHTPESFANANGLRLCYDTFGDPTAAPLLLIMGLGAQMVLWDDDFCTQLAEQGFYVIRFDNRDIGRSTHLDAPARVDLPALLMQQIQGKPITAPYLLRDMANDAAALLEALGIASAHIVGASMGGMIAQELAVHHPTRVRSLVSIMSTTGQPGLPSPTPEAAAVLMAPPPTSRDDYIAAFARNWRVLRAGSFPADEARDPTRAALFYARGLNPQGVARQLLAIFASGDRSPGLATIKAPSLIIHGDADPLVPHAAGLATHAAIAGSQMLTIPGMGHALPMVFWPQIITAIAEHAKSKEAVLF